MPTPKLVGLAAVLFAGCTCSRTQGPPDAAADAPSVADAASAEVDDQDKDDEVRPVYPIDGQPPVPLAERYCAIVKETPRRRREECCPAMGAFAMTSECVRTLSAALRSSAVMIAAADLDACAEAVKKETADCDWVGSTGSPTAPACLGIIKGTLKLGAVCRSNLECEEGARCRGLGTTRPGRCAQPLPAESGCGTPIDSLASFTGQEDFERHHAPCTGYCAGRKCADAIAIGGPCTQSAQCGEKARCVAGKCSDGPLPERGQACTDACAPGARCWKGTCAATKAVGETCEEDVECRAHCERADGGKLGRCQAQCPSFPALKKRR